MRPDSFWIRGAFVCARHLRDFVTGRESHLGPDQNMVWRARCML